MNLRPFALAACTVALVITGGGGVASASVDMETGIADDAQLLYRGPAVAAKVVSDWQAAGIDTVRLHARWAFVAPDIRSTREPHGFDPSNPDDPRYKWSLLDTAIALLDRAGIQPIVTITGSGPLWGTRHPSLHNPRYDPDPRAFAAFAHAVAERYRGRVRRYIIWNEPNQPGWLQPQFSCRAHHCTPRSPAIYRNLYRSSSAAIRRADPTAEILMGALAPRGHSPTKANVPMHPLQFLRSLGCVNRRYRRVHSGGCARATALTAFGFAYHPHPVRLLPAQHAHNRDDASIGDLHRLEHALDRTTAHGILKPSYGRRFNLYLTEFGYQTNPPDLKAGVTPRQQAERIQHADFIGYSDPRVKNMTGYLWRDEPLRTGAKRYAGWQSGLFYADGREKMLGRVFEHPFFADSHPGHEATFWGQVRPGGAWTVRLEQRVSEHWETITTVQTNADGYWTYRAAVPRKTIFRFQYDVASPDTGEPAVTRTSATQSVARTTR